MYPNLRIIYASGSGHTEYVVDTLAAMLREIDPAITVVSQRAERTKPEDLTDGDLTVLATGTWNTNGVEGQLHPYMYELLVERAKDVKLENRPVAFISLGDDRYYYTTRCTEHLQRFIKSHGGRLALPPLVVVNEPYGQEEKIGKWAKKLAEQVKTIASPSPAK